MVTGSEILKLPRGKKLGIFDAARCCSPLTLTSPYPNDYEHLFPTRRLSFLKHLNTDFQFSLSRRWSTILFLAHACFCFLQSRCFRARSSSYRFGIRMRLACLGGRADLSYLSHREFIFSYFLSFYRWFILSNFLIKCFGECGFCLIMWSLFSNYLVQTLYSCALGTLGL